jgi:hypothetical protein
LKEAQNKIIPTKKFCKKIRFCFRKRGHFAQNKLAQNQVKKK